MSKFTSATDELLSSLTARTMFDLGMRLDESMPQFHPDQALRFARRWTADPTSSAHAPLVFAVEAIEGSIHTSTHIDAPVHAIVDGAIFGGSRVDDVVSGASFTEHGVETIAPIVARGVLLDIPRAQATGRLPDGYEITVDDMADSIARQGTPLRPGDVALIRTGKILDYTIGDAFVQAQPGVGVDAAVWLAERDIVALGTDTAGTEPLPLADPTRTVHGAMLVNRGVYLIENLWLEDLAVNHAHVFLFICLPLKMTGATGSWVRPIALV